MLMMIIMARTSWRRGRQTAWSEEGEKEKKKWGRNWLLLSEKRKQQRTLRHC